MTGVYSFRPGPTYRGATRQELFDAAMAEPLSIASTFFGQAKGDALESFGLGTVLRENLLPPEAPTEPGLVLRTEDGQRVDLPDTPAMRRRRAAFGDLAGNIQPETTQEFEARRDEAGALTEDQYKASPSFRTNIPWDAGMTKARAEALAAMDDAKRVREFYAEKRPISAFLGSLTGQALDPINYIPVAGPLVKAAAVARFGRVGGAALHSALDAAGNTAVFGVATADQRAKFGDDVSWQATISQIATAALIGGAFGTVAGTIGKRVDARAVREADQRLATLKTTQEARIALNEGIDALVRGEDVNLSPNATEPMARVASEIPSAMPKADFVTEVRGSSHGQMDMTLRMKAGGEEVGRIDFAEFEGRPSIQMIEVSEAHRRKGYATALLQELQAKYPDQEIDWGSLTTDGAKLRESTAFKEIPSDEAPKFAELETAREAVKAIEAERVSKWEQGKPLDQQSPEVQELAAREIDAANVVSDLEFQLRGAVPIKRLIAPPERRAATGIDTSGPHPEPIPEGRAQAETRIAKPDDGKALADQYRIDPQTGAFAEEGEIAQLEAEGRLTEDDAATLAAAQADFETGAAYAEALKSVAGCLI